MLKKGTYSLEFKGPAAVYRYRLTATGPVQEEVFSDPGMFRLTNNHFFRHRDRKILAAMGAPAFIYLADAEQMSFLKRLELSSPNPDVPCYIGTFTPSIDGEKLYVQTTRSFQIIDVDSGHRFARVWLDAYAASGVSMEKFRYIHAPEYMSPANLYGVTFERATAVQLGQTDFLFVSGTASIDTSGNIVHPGDVVAQADRTLQNIQGILDAADFQRADLSSFIVYLRDATDYRFVRPVLDSFAPDLPCVYVKAPVCRPGWLIEIEATAARTL